MKSSHRVGEIAYLTTGCFPVKPLLPHPYVLSLFYLKWCHFFGCSRCDSLLHGSVYVIVILWSYNGGAIWKLALSKRGVVHSYLWRRSTLQWRRSTIQWRGSSLQRRRLLLSTCRCHGHGNCAHKHGCVFRSKHMMAIERAVILD